MGKQYIDMDFASHEVQTIYPPITPYLYKKLEKKFNTMIKQKLLQIRSKITQYENDIEKIGADIIEDDIQADLASFGPDIGSSLMKKLDNSNFFYVLIFYFIYIFSIAYK